MKALLDFIADGSNTETVTIEVKSCGITKVSSFRQLHRILHQTYHASHRTSKINVR